MLTMREQREQNEMFGMVADGSMRLSEPDPFERPAKFDPHALAMALQLADLLAAEAPLTSAAFSMLQRLDGRKPNRVSDWLRVEVQRELMGQP